MGNLKFKLHISKWPEKEEEEAKERLLLQDQYQDQLELDFNSQLEESQDSSELDNTPKESVQVHQSILPPFLNTSPLRFSNLQETLPRTTRKPESSQDTFNSPSETMKNSPNFSATPPLLLEVFSQTFASLFSHQTRRRNECLN